jgi:tetratricopeptide (TPR) repeat protein
VRIRTGRANSRARIVSEIILALVFLTLPGLICYGAVETSCVDESVKVPEEGLRYEMAGKWQEALDLYRSILETRPQRVDLRLRIADIEVRLGNQAAAAIALMEAAQFCGKDPDLFARASQAFSAAGQPDRALDAIRHALAIEPENIEYLLAHAQLACWNVQYSDAAESYRRVLKRSPTNKDALLGIARLLSWNGKMDQASKAYNRYLQLYPDDGDVILAAARNELWRGNAPAALDLLGKYKARFGETPGYLKTAARVLASAKRPREALSVLARLPEGSAPDYETLYAEALALYYANRPLEAFDLLEKLSKLEGHEKETNDLKHLLLNPFQPDIVAGGRFYAESDSLRIVSLSTVGNYFAGPLTHIWAGDRTDFLWAQRGSGLAEVGGGQSSWHTCNFIGASHYFSPEIVMGVEAGAALIPDDDIFAYRVDAGWLPADQLKVEFQRRYDFFPVSPRTLSKDIRIGENLGHVYWTPDLKDTVEAFFSYDTLTDDNARWQLVMAPRRSVLRTENLNLDLGLSAGWLSYDKTLEDGYYSPQLYSRYLATSFWYWKINPENGVGIILGLGTLKDETMKDYEFGGNIDAEGTFALSGQWILKVNAGAFHNVRSVTGSFDAVQTGVVLARRF